MPDETDRALFERRNPRSLITIGKQGAKTRGCHHWDLMPMKRRPVLHAGVITSGPFGTNPAGDLDIASSTCKS